MATIQGRKTVGIVNSLCFSDDPSAGGGTIAPIGSFGGTVDGTGFWYKSGSGDTSWSKVVLAGNDYFTIPLETGTLNPSDSTTYYFGMLRLPPGTTATNFDFNIGFACTIVGGIISVGNNTVQGTNENNTLQIRNVTQATSSSMGTFTTNAASGDIISTTFSELSIAVGASDFICAQFDTPAYATNPTNVLYFLTLILKK